MTTGGRGSLVPGRRFAAITVAVAAIAIGAVLLARPVTSLDALALLIGAGLVTVAVLALAGRRQSRPALRAVVAVVAGTAGATVLVLPGLTVRLVAVLAGVALIVHAGTWLAAALDRRRDADARVAAGAHAMAGAVFGVLALSWPDITLLAVSAAFGAGLLLGGVALAWSELGLPGLRRKAGEPRRFARATAAAVSIVLAGAAAVTSAVVHDGSPVVDDFYAAPRDVPAEPGTLIRAEAFTRSVPAGARGWRILYTTTRGDGEAAVASGIVVVPSSEGPWPVVAWNHGTTGYARQCAPSLASEPFESGALFVLPEIVAEGWALVATDYIGLGSEGPHPYMVGPDSAHASLDAVRAARELTPAALAPDTVVWGHSQGGAAALWTGALADAYAPDVEVTAVAALAPAAALPDFVDVLGEMAGGSVLASFVMSGYSAAYDDVSWSDYVDPGAEPLMRAMAERCLAEPGMMVTVLEALALSHDPRVFSADPLGGALGERLQQNVPPPSASAPLLVAQGGADAIIATTAQDGFVEGLCAAGQRVDYRVYEGRDHVPLVEPGSPAVADLMEWTRERLAGEPVAAGCEVGGRP